MKKILSIDGGGVRGIIPGMVLIALEEKLKIKTGNPKAAILDYFDFFAGTSTGGILTCLLLCPDDADPTRPKYSAREAVNLYLSQGSDIFKMSFLKKVLSGIGWVSERYDSTVFENVLESYFDKIKLSQLIKPCIISAYNIELRKTHFFRQQAAIKRGDIRDFYIKDVCRATCAAPTYFSVAEIYSLANIRYPLLDGGVFATNPALSALIEVTKTNIDTRIQDLFIISLGTGASKRSYDYEYFKRSKAISIVPALIDIMMSGVAETSDFFLKQIFKSMRKPNQYIRIDPASLDSINERLDAAYDVNLKKLQALGDQTVSEKDALLNHIVDLLIEERELTVDNG